MQSIEIHLTDNARNKVKGFIASQSAESDGQKGLRIYVEGGGCSGFQYGFNIDAASEEDFVLDVEEGIRIIVDQISAPYIKESTVDYSEGLMNAGFIVQNPNAKATCGCGLSFGM